MFTRYQPRKVIIFSRDELKQFEMRQQFDEDQFPCIRYFIGDVHDRERLDRAFDGVSIVVQTAALKQIPVAEYNPSEAVKTNVPGAMNVIYGAIDCNVKKVIALSTDKAANPINLYSATKLCSDKLFGAASSYSDHHSTRFSIVRYGNVVGSRGSVIPFFLKMRKTRVLPIADERMTHFWITLEQGVDFVLASLERMRGGEIFVPKIPSMHVTDLARAVAPECDIKFVGIRSDEKLHEVTVPADDSHHTLEYDDHFAIMPTFHEWSAEEYILKNGGKLCPDGFRYSSDTNTRWLTMEELRTMAGLTEKENAGTSD